MVFNGKISRKEGKSSYGFIDLEKAYNKVARDLIWWVLDRRVSQGVIEIIKDMYGGVVPSVTTICVETSEFLVTTCFHEVSTLYSYLFLLIMDEFTSYSSGCTLNFFFFLQMT